MSEPLKVHWLFRAGTQRLAYCTITARGPLTEDPRAVTCKNCVRRLRSLGLLQPAEVTAS